MAYFYRLIVLFLLSSSAFAVIPRVSSVEYWAGGWDQTKGSSKSSACAAYVSFLNSNPDVVYSAVSSDPLCTYKYVQGGMTYGNLSVSYTVHSVLACPDNSTLSGQSCVCNSPLVENEAGNACMPPETLEMAYCKLLAGQDTYFTVPGSVLPGSSICGELGCKLDVSDFVLTYVDKTSKLKTSQGDALISKDPCQPEPSPAAPVATTCKGGSFGQVNGVDVCIPFDTSKGTLETTKKTEKTEENPDGSTTTTTTKDKTVCTGPTCTTTTETTISGGPAGTPDKTKTDEKTESKDDFCKENPRVAGCSLSTFAGACDAPPTCKGDAIQCAVAAQTLKTACALDPKDNGEAAAFEEAKSKTGSQIGDLPGNDSVSIGSSSFDTTDAIGAGSCIADMSVTVAGSSITIPFSKVCSSLAILGNLLMMVSFLLAGRIVVRG